MKSAHVAGIGPVELHATQVGPDDVLLPIGLFDSMHPTLLTWHLVAEVSDLGSWLEGRGVPAQFVVLGGTTEIRFEFYEVDSDDAGTHGWRFRPTVQSQALLGDRTVEVLIIND